MDDTGTCPESGRVPNQCARSTGLTLLESARLQRGDQEEPPTLGEVRLPWRYAGCDLGTGQPLPRIVSGLCNTDSSSGGGGTRLPVRCCHMQQKPHKRLLRLPQGTAREK
jgi:hypothetical protein